MSCPTLSKSIAFSLLAFAALAFSLFVSFLAAAQVVGANLSGTVKDPSGAVIPNAKVSIRNVATDVTREVTTDAAGFYSTPNLLPGNYDVKPSAPGFSTLVRAAIELTVGQQQVLNFTLQVGQTKQTVEVTTEAPTVELASSSISAVVESTTVRELPLNGRSWTDLATLQPGVNAIETQQDPTAGGGRGKRGFAAEITISGARPQWNNYRLDGISMNDSTNGGPGSVLGGNLGVDAIQEFSVITSNYSAEYGKTAGGVINAITRSGTNVFHGSVYEFLRNSALDARNFFDPATIPPFRRNQFGADAGGPVRKDKIFLFGDYEGIRQSKGISSLEAVPSVAARSGMLCSAPSPSSTCSPTTVIVDPAAQKYLGFYPLPNNGIQPGSNGDLGIFIFSPQQVITENFFTTRGDIRFREKDNMYVTYLRDYTTFTQPSAFLATLFGSKTNRQVATVEETHTFSPTLVNSARIGYSRDSLTDNASLSAINSLANDTSLAAIPGKTAAGLKISGLPNFKGGIASNSAVLVGWNSYQVYDDAFWTHGTHSLKFGGGVERIQDNEITTSDGGNFTFKRLSNFLTNVPGKFSHGSGTGNDYRNTLFGLYVQDDWRVRPNLMLNIGLRWEMVTQPTEVLGHLENLINLTDPTVHTGSLFSSNRTLRNFEPRLGFSWDPFQNGKTAVRGGFGIFDVQPLPYEFNNTENMVGPFNISSDVNKLPPGSFPAGAASLLTPSTAEEAFFQQPAHRTYVMQWNFNVQREMPGRVTGVLSYVGSRGVHLPFRTDDADIVLPTSTPAGYLFPSPVGNGTKLNLNFGGIFGMFYDNNSFYNGLQLGVQKALSHGLQVQGSFTWGRGLDSGSSTVGGDQFSNSITSLPFYDLKSLRGPSDFNIARTVVVNVLWQVPSPKSFSGPAAWITSGWELGAIYKANDGVPFTPSFGTSGDPLGLNSATTFDSPNRLGGPGCQSLVNPGNPNNYIKTQCFAVPTAPSVAFFNMPAPLGCDPAFGQSTNPNAPQYLWCFNLRGNAGRNIIIGPGLSNLDFSVYKNNYIKRISENFNVQFRAEFFNILNRPNFNVPVTPDNTDIFDPTGTPTGVAGLLTSTATTAREIQFALKVIW